MAFEIGKTSVKLDVYLFDRKPRVSLPSLEWPCPDILDLSSREEPQAYKRLAESLGNLYVQWRQDRSGKERAYPKFSSTLIPITQKIGIMAARMGLPASPVAPLLSGVFEAMLEENHGIREGWQGIFSEGNLGSLPSLTPKLPTLFAHDDITQVVLAGFTSGWRMQHYLNSKSSHESSYRRGMRYNAIGMYGWALPNFTMALNESPKNLAIYKAKGIAHYMMDQGSDAFRDLTEALRHAPKDPELYQYRGKVLLGAGKFDEAIEDFTKAWSLHSKNAAVFLHRAVAYYLTERLTQAVDDLTLALEYNPHEASAFFIRASIHYELNQFSEALRDCSEALELNPLSAETFNLMGKLYFEDKKPKRALKNFSRAIQLTPESANYYLLRGQAYSALRKYPRALADFNNALALAPNNSNALLHRGTLFQEQDKNWRALKDFEKALLLDPKNPTIFLAIALSRYNLGHFSQALAAAYMAAQIDPDNARKYLEAIEVYPQD